MRNATIVDRLMGEHIEMPGCPQLVVTRAEAWHFLASIGCETDTRKSQFGSVDYMVFRRNAVDAPLSNPAFRDRVFAVMKAHEC